MSSESATELRARLNAETGRIRWPELSPHFARGAVVRVARSLDLIEVAANFVENKAERVEEWLAVGEIAVATDADARRWTESEPEFWAVVVAPWVLVQETEPASQANEPAKK